jgi:hypothetical protein
VLNILKLGLIGHRKRRFLKVSAFVWVGGMDLAPNLDSAIFKKNFLESLELELLT